MVSTFMRNQSSVQDGDFDWKNGQVFELLDRNEAINMVTEGRGAEGWWERQDQSKAW